MEKLTVGKKLWWVRVGNSRVQQCEVTVTKIGRKWAQLDNLERIDVETLVADAGGYSPSSRCYPSREAYEQEVTLSKAWADLKRDLQYKAPEGITADNIAAARKLLGM